MLTVDCSSTKLNVKPATTCTMYHACPVTSLTIMMKMAKVMPMTRKSPSRVTTLSPTSTKLVLPLLEQKCWISTLNTTLPVRNITMELSHSTQPHILYNSNSNNCKKSSVYLKVQYNTSKADQCVPLRHVQVRVKVHVVQNVHVFTCTCTYVHCHRYMYIGCAVLLCLVCLFDLACFFLSSFSSLI